MSEFRIKTLHKQGNVAIWGAGAKGVTLVGLIDENRTLINCLVDINRNKQGKFVAGSGHPIVGAENLEELNIKNIILMNPNYRDEIMQILVDNNIEANLIE